MGGGGSGVFVGDGGCTVLVLVGVRGVLVGDGGRSVLVAVGRGVMVGCTILVLVGGRTVAVADAGIKSAVFVVVAPNTVLAWVGDRGVKAFVAYWEDVIGINAATPANFPVSFATQQSTERSLEIRHQVFSLFLPMTSTVSPDGMFSTTLYAVPGPLRQSEFFVNVKKAPVDVGVKLGDGVGEAVGPVGVGVGVEVRMFISSGLRRGREKNGPHAEAMSTNPASTNTKKILWIIDLPHNKFITTE